MKLTIDEDIHRAMVVSDNGSVAGIVTPMDVLRALVRGDDVAVSVSGTGSMEFVDLRELIQGSERPPRRSVSAAVAARCLQSGRDMQVRTPMTREVIVAPPRLSVADAWRVLQRESIRHLPITEGGRLVGIVSDRDLLRAGRPVASGDLTFSNQTVAEIMSMGLVVCSPGASVADAVRLMTEGKIDALPVVEGDRLVGLVTSTDLLLLLIDHAPAQVLPFDFRVAEAVLVA